MTIEEIYKKGTAEQLWNAWDPKQRIHFLEDHDAIINKMSRKAGFEIPKRTAQGLKKVQTEFAAEKFNDLHTVIQKAIAIHHATGFYNEGGRAGIKTTMKTPYQTPDKKKLQSKLYSIKEKMQKVQDPRVLASLNAHIQKLESILNTKTPMHDKLAGWKQEKANKLVRKG